MNIKDVLINVEHIDHSFMDAAGDFSGFNKLVGRGETDERPDAAAHLLKELIEVTRNGLSGMLDKQDTTIEVLKSG